MFLGSRLGISFSIRHTICTGFDLEPLSTDLHPWLVPTDAQSVYKVASEATHIGRSILRTILLPANDDPAFVGQSLDTDDAIGRFGEIGLHEPLVSRGRSSGIDRAPLKHTIVSVTDRRNQERPNRICDPAHIAVCRLASEVNLRYFLVVSNIEQTLAVFHGDD